MSLPDVSPYMATDTEVGVCLTFPDGTTWTLTADQWDALAIEVDDVLVIDPAELHSELAAQAAIDQIRGK